MYVIINANVTFCVLQSYHKYVSWGYELNITLRMLRKIITLKVKMYMLKYDIFIVGLSRLFKMLFKS